jgi:hypothetical protein
MSELDALDPVPNTLTLTTGTEVKLLDLKARQFFKMLRIISHGPAMAALSNSNNLLQGDPEAVVMRLVGFLLVSIPDAYDETLAFLQDMVQPVGLQEVSANMDKVAKTAATKWNADKWAELAAAMDNPEIEDVIDLTDAIVKRESADLVALGKKVASLFKVAEKTGQLAQPTSQTSQDQNTLVDSAGPSTP